VNDTVLLAAPDAFFTDTKRVDFVAVEPIVKVAVSPVPAVPTGATDETVMPPPVIWIGMAESPVRFFPARVTLTVVPAFPLAGLMPVNDGDPPPDDPFTEKLTVPVVPLGVDTLTL